MTALLRNNLLLCVAYALTGWLALQIAVPPGYAAPLFPAAGVALVALMNFGPASIPGVFCGSLIVQLLAAWQTGIEGSAWIALFVPALGAAAQSAFGLYLVRRFTRKDGALDSSEDILRFVCIVAPVGCLISPSVGTGVLVMLGAVPPEAAPFTWINWWAGDTLGVLVMVPLLQVFVGQPVAAWHSRRMAVAVPMGVALGLLAFTFLQVRDWETARLQSQFNQQAEYLASQIRQRLSDQMDQMVALERLATVHPGLSQEDWRSFVTPLLDRHPGTQNFGWSPLVRDEERAAFERSVQQQGIPGFSILGRNPSGQTFTAEHKAEYLPIVLVEPLETNRGVIGLDPLVLERTAVAARLTRDLRRPVASQSIRLVQESGEQRGVVIYQAVFSPDGLVQKGMVSGVFRMDDAIRATLASVDHTQVGVCLTDNSEAGAIERLYGPAGCDAEGWPGKRLSWSAPLLFGERQWLLRINATQAYMNGLLSWSVWLTLALGMLSTGILGAFLLLTSGRARRVEVLVEQRTRQLAIASQRLEAQQDELVQAQRIARLGSWESLPDSSTLRCSAELLSILNLGDDPSEINQARLLASIHPDDQPALQAALKRANEAAEQINLDCRINAGGHVHEILHFRIESDYLEGGRLRIRGTAQDVTAARAADAHIAYLAHYDVLTGLPNRVQWNERAQSELRDAARQNESLAVLFLDLDHFKSVNDSLGHPVGDQLLASVSRRFIACLRENDFIARLGGDEFVVLLPHLGHPEDAALVARKLIAALNLPVQVGEHELSASVSIGIAVFPDDGDDVSTLLKHADVAMYSAKDQGRNTYHYFVPEMDVHALERLMLENALRRAIERNELVLYYQPQVAAQDARVIGCEALVRWQHPELGMLPPVQFITVAEESGLIQSLGEWVLYEACRQVVAWADKGFADLVVAVNISALQFRQAEFVVMVRRILRETGAAASQLELELTESALMQPTPEVLARMNELRELGIRLALDDFGTGYSSLSYLKRLPINRLKLDRSFVKDLPDDTEDAAIASATLSLARNLAMDVVAEGVETLAQRDFLAERGCPVMQGYLYSRPVPADEFERWLADQR